MEQANKGSKIKITRNIKTWNDLVLRLFQKGKDNSFMKVDRRFDQLTFKPKTNINIIALINDYLKLIFDYDKPVNDYDQLRLNDPELKKNIRLRID